MRELEGAVQLQDVTNAINGAALQFYANADSGAKFIDSIRRYLKQMPQGGTNLVHVYPEDINQLTPSRREDRRKLPRIPEEFTDLLRKGRIETIRSKRIAIGAIIEIDMCMYLGARTEVYDMSLAERLDGKPKPVNQGNRFRIETHQTKLFSPGTSAYVEFIDGRIGQLQEQIRPVVTHTIMGARPMTY